MIIEVKTPYKLKDPFCFDGPSGCFSYFLRNTTPLQVIVETNDTDLKGDLKKHIISAEIEIILDLLSWFLDIPIIDYKVKNRKVFPTGSFVNFEKKLLGKRITNEKYELLSAHREIQNEKNPALR